MRSSFWLIMIINNCTDMKNRSVFKGIEPAKQFSRPHRTKACPVREAEQIIAMQNMICRMDNSVRTKISAFYEVIRLSLDRAYPFLVNLHESIFSLENDSIRIPRSKQPTKERIFVILEILNTLSTLIVV